MENMKKKINFQVNKDIADHPHFHFDFLKLVSSYEDSKDIICKECKHSLFEHIKSGANGYCVTCYKNGKWCKTLKRYFSKSKKDA